MGTRSRLSLLRVICRFHMNLRGQLSLRLAPVTKRVHQPPGFNALQLLFGKHSQSFADQYGAKYAITYGRFRIERITGALRRFVLCGDFTQGIARIR